MNQPLPHASPTPAARPFAPPLLPPMVVNALLIALIALLWPVAGVLSKNLNPYALQVLILVGIAIIMATSLNLINGITGQFSLGHAGFMAVGAYTAGVVFKHYYNFNWGGWTESGVFLGVLLLGGIIAAIAGFVVGIPTLRLAGDYLAIATLGFGEIIVLILTNTDSIRIPFAPAAPGGANGPGNVFDVGGASGLHSIPQPTPEHYFFWTYGWAIICVVTVWRMAYSARGKAFLAVREDEIAARAVGIDTTRQKVVAFVIGAFFAGIGGGLSAMWNLNLDPGGFNFMRSIEFVVMVVLGGSGSITGVILAAIVLTLLPEELRFFAQWRMVVYSLLLIIMMLVRPQGLLGRRELWWTRRRRLHASS